jgi:hypothetical protein
VVEDARAVITWCRVKNHSQLVRRPLYQDMQDDADSHWQVWRKLENLKRLVDQPHSNIYKEAFDLLDQAYPDWRGRKRGTASRIRWTRQRLQHIRCDVFWCY